jgi:hypothetical protein
MEFSTERGSIQDFLILILLAAVTVVISIPRFGYVYPDSGYYLDMVEFFSGNLSGTDLVAPFCYRPLLPLIAAVIPFSPEVTFSVINLIFLVLISWMIFFIARKHTESDFTGFLATLVFTISLVYLFYGAVVLVEPGAVFFLVLGYYLIPEDGNSMLIAIVLSLGVLFKEVALVGVITYLVYRRFRDWWWMIPPIATYGLIRLVTPSGNPEFLWAFHLDNVTIFASATVRTLIYGLGPIMVFLLLGILFVRKKGDQELLDMKWYIASGIPAIGYMLLGLFFAHFDVRFLWPFYLMMIPLVTYGTRMIMQTLSSIVRKED